MRSSELLGATGPLASALKGYELREPQLRMAEMVETALEREGVALIEAGTGTGKTLAYLVPAIRSGRKVTAAEARRAPRSHHQLRPIPRRERKSTPDQG